MSDTKEIKFCDLTGCVHYTTSTCEACDLTCAVTVEVLVERMNKLIDLYYKEKYQ